MDTRTLEIPKDQWTPFLSRVEVAQRDKQVRVEVISADLGDQQLSAPSALRAISAHSPKGSSKTTIEVDLGGDGGLDHRVLHPLHLFAIQTPSGELECLEIEGEDEQKTLIRFEAAALPDLRGRSSR